jgi:hypothetical protein
MVQTLSWLCATLSHHVIPMLVRGHRSAAILNLGFGLLQSEQGLLQLKPLSFRFLAHLEQLLEIHGVQQRPTVPRLVQQAQPEVPVVQG